MRVVLDSNVLISAAILSESVSRRCFDAARFHHRLLSSGVVLDEVLEVARRPKLNRYLSLERRLDFFRAYFELVELIDVASTITACRDDDDNRLLEIAVDGHADFLVTGDKDLLVLADQFPFQIATPRAFLDAVTRG